MSEVEEAKARLVDEAMGARDAIGGGLLTAAAAAAAAWHIYHTWKLKQHWDSMSESAKRQAIPLLKRDLKRVSRFLSQRVQNAILRAAEAAMKAGSSAKKKAVKQINRFR